MEFKLVVAAEIILKEFAVGEGGKFLAEFDVFILAVVVAAFVEAHVFGVGEATVEVFGFEHGGGLGCASGALVFVLADAHLRAVSVPAGDFGAAPGVSLALPRHHAVPF
jgi:hypothetical protein